VSFVVVHSKDGVVAAYRNDQRQEFVNNLAYKHGTGLGTAPWYGVPGTAYDFGSSKSAGPTYHTDASHPTGYGYQGSVSQYHSQPSYSAAGYGKTAKEHVHTTAAGKSAGTGRHCSCSNAERLDIPPPHTKYPHRLDKDGIPVPSAGYRASPAVIGDGVGYGLAIDGKGAAYNEPGRASSYDPNTAAGSKVGYDDMTVPAGYVSGRYASLGYGYMY